MATTLRDWTGAYPFPAYHGPQPAKSAEMRKAERAELKAAKRRVRLMLENQREAVAQGLPPSARPSRRRYSRPGFADKVVNAILRRWFDDEAGRVPLVMRDYRYWQARSAGFDPQPGRDEQGIPTGPLAEWFASWWCALHWETRDSLVRSQREFYATLNIRR